jgi:hypothetical protein
VALCPLAADVPVRQAWDKEMPTFSLAAYVLAIGRKHAGDEGVCERPTAMNVVLCVRLRAQVSFQTF